MPSPLERPARPTAPVLPTNLDALVREALAGGDIGKLKSAMQSARASAPAAPSPPRPPPSPPVVAAVPRPPPALAPPRTPLAQPPPRRVSAPVPPAADALAHRLAMLVTAAQKAADAYAAGRSVPASVREVEAALAAVRQLVPAAVPPPNRPLHPEPIVPARAPLPPSLVAPPISVPLPPEPPIPLPVAPTRVRPPVELPRYRHRWLLVLSGPGDAALGPALAQALQVDGVTARFAAIARTPRVALRGDDPQVLRAAGTAVQRLGLSAVVVSREDLAAIAAPDVVLAVAGAGRFSVSATWPFDADPPEELPADVRSLPWSGMRMAVPGEVTVRRYRMGRSLARGRRSEPVLRLGNERRLAVVDLHGPGRFLRLVAGLSNTDGLPGHDPRSAVRAFKGFVESLPDFISGCRVHGARSCAPGEAPPIPDGYDASTPIEATGWALWEEHTRMCRLLGGLPGDDVPVERA